LYASLIGVNLAGSKRRKGHELPHNGPLLSMRNFLLLFKLSTLVMLNFFFGRYCESRRKVLLDHVHEGYDKELWDYMEIVN